MLHMRYDTIHLGTDPTHTISQDMIQAIKSVKSFQDHTLPDGDMIYLTDRISKSSGENEITADVWPTVVGSVDTLTVRVVRGDKALVPKGYRH